MIVTKKKVQKIFSLGGRNDRQAQSAPPPRGNRWFNTQGVIGLKKSFFYYNSIHFMKKGRGTWLLWSPIY